jgi:hypothetical protein
MSSTQSLVESKNRVDIAEPNMGAMLAEPPKGGELIFISSEAVLATVLEAFV